MSHHKTRPFTKISNPNHRDTEFSLYFLRVSVTPWFKKRRFDYGSATTRREMRLERLPKVLGKVAPDAVDVGAAVA